MWKFQGEVVCGAEEEREEVVQSAQRVTGNGAGFSSQGQTILSTCRGAQVFLGPSPPP